MTDPSPDTPTERDSKAEVLRVEREELARIIAQETRKFRWEVRLYWVAMAVILYINTK